MYKFPTVLPAFPAPPPFSTLSDAQRRLINPPHQASESLFLARFDGSWQGAWRIYAGAPEAALAVLHRNYTPPAPASSDVSDRPPLPGAGGLFQHPEAVFLLPGAESLPFSADEEPLPEANPDLPGLIADWTAYSCIRRIYVYRTPEPEPSVSSASTGVWELLEHPERLERLNGNG